VRSQRERVVLRSWAHGRGRHAARDLRACSLALLFISVLRVPAGAQRIPGFTDSTSVAQRELEAHFLAVPSAASARATVQLLARAPHLAGTPETRTLADSLAEELRRLGFEVQIERFDPWLPHPLRIEAALTAPVQRTLTVREPPAESGAADTAAVLWNWLAYGANGQAERQVVYANFGLPSDYASLERAGVRVRNRIVLARLGGAFRGVKVAEAERHGAAGLILFPDPAADGFGAGDTVPAGPYRPSWSVQRGTLMYMWRYTGDPLTPGRPAVAGVERIDPRNASNLPRIPVVTIGYGDAAGILEHLSGQSLDGFRGGLPVGYRTGPGPARVRIASEQLFAERAIYNVIATIQGEIDRPVILGNHFDAWVSGGADPHIGTAVTMEIARGMGALMQSGWKPRRTIIVALWDAEEYGVVGSSEWVEMHRDRLSADAVAYFNIDTFTAGTLDVTGSPALGEVVFSAAGEVRDPVTGRTLAAEWSERNAEVGDIGAGSDWTAFLHHAGVPSLQWTMNGRGIYAVYHSSLDTSGYVEQFVDPDFLYTPALASVMGIALLRIAQADIVPFRYAGYADRIARHIAQREAQARAAGMALDVAAIQAALGRFRNAAVRAEDGINVDQEALDAALPRVETAFLTEQGLPGRPWYRHPLNAPGASTGYDALPLPAIAEAIEARDPVALRNAVAVVAAAIGRAAEVLEAALR
jgi:N-acetylated-alpha-linked acidic dipeptidase